MASSQFIPPFPPDEDRIGFGHWLSGFTDGEGSFGLRWQGNKSSPNTGIARFTISLRRDDRPILETIQSFWGCGRMNDVKANISVPNARPTSAYHVTQLGDLMRIVIPHFDAFPLRAKKARDFSIWREGVMLLDQIKSRTMRGRRGFSPWLRGQSRWTPQDKAKFQSLVDAIQAVREFDPPPIPQILTEGETDQLSFAFDD